ncbi:MAG: glycosyltransferase [Polaromonas sp.]|uniref:glycosyltransferase n=1 Tax=Polaromonas sp. TaxID=1869339 RepID=UPI002731B74B|nr:glycosyltransferase [Polaromonas sp.]MDP2450423.1 glycosyltransferase [Polaromonas sp.]MDP3247159.1 glycosyltransferase [Polaromonas sp.]
MKISVCMATYNGAAHVETQISSILKQLNDADQLIVVDDKSTDNTVEIIGNFRDARIQLIINPINVGAALTFNRALQEAGGDIVFLSDQDDRWHDGKVATVVKMLEAGKLDLVVHDAVVMRDGQVLHASLFEMAGSSPGVIKNIVSNTFTGCCMAFRRDILRDVLPISPHIGIFHDAWIGVLAQYFGYRVSFLSVPLMDFIRHGGNASTLQRRSIVPIILDRVAFVAALTLQIGRVYFRRLMKQPGVIR